MPGVELEYQPPAERRVEYSRAVYNTAGAQRIAEEKMLGAGRVQRGEPALGVGVLGAAVDQAHPLNGVEGGSSARRRRAA